MKRAGYALASLALGLAVVALALHSMGISKPATIIGIAFLISMLLGAIALTISSVRRIAAGEVKLRPQLALRSAPLTFLIILVLRSLLEVFFGDLHDNWVAILLFSAVMTILISLSSTAYRRTS